VRIFFVRWGARGEKRAGKKRAGDEDKCGRVSGEECGRGSGEE
jgi:hypothetical protein